MIIALRAVRPDYRELLLMTHRLLLLCGMMFVVWIFVQQSGSALTCGIKATRWSALGNWNDLIDFIEEEFNESFNAV